MSEPRWRGSTEIHEQPGSPIRRRRADGIYYERVFSGPYEALIAAEPAPGIQMADLPEGVLVDEAVTAPLGAGPLGPGRMTVSASLPAGDIPEDPNQPTVEIDGTTLQKPLEQHPHFQPGALPHNLTEEQVRNMWRDVRKKLDGEDFQDTFPDEPWGAMMVEAYDRLARGQEYYIVPAPVVRKTTRGYLGRPQVAAIGTRQNPTVTGIPPGYQWLKTADRAVRTGRRGRWERVEEWTGADEWDNLIYPEG